MKVIVIGGGWSGVAASIAARKKGAEVSLLEKTDMLLGCGNAGGIMRNNGRYTAAEEMIALGAGELFQLIDNIAVHKNIDFPGHKHATLYPVNIIEAYVRRLVESLGIHVFTETHVSGVDFHGKKIDAIMTDDKRRFEGDVFVETTGSSGPMGNCLRYGNGCSMCVLRCPAYGPRISISGRCGVMDYQGERTPDVFGLFSGSCKLSKESLSLELQKKLNSAGVAIIPLPAEDIDKTKLGKKACRQYALKEYCENLILLDTGDVKMMTSYFPLGKLRRLIGLENARYVDPYAGSKGNSVRYLSVAPRTDAMQVDNMDNLFCGGEKSGLFIGHTEAIVTGTLAGFNAVQKCLEKQLLVLPSELAVGDIISVANNEVKNRENRLERFTFAGGNYFKRMLNLGLYTTDIDLIRQRVEKTGLSGIFRQV